jgi:hypothetical protein
MTPPTSSQARANNQSEAEEQSTATGTSSSSAIPKGVTTRQQAIQLKTSDVRLICAEEIEKYHNKIQESLDDLKSSIHHIANVLTMTREEVGNQLTNMQDCLTENSKELPSQNDGNEVDNKTEGLNGDNEVSKVRREDDAMNIEDKHGGIKSKSRQHKHAHSKGKNRLSKQRMSTRTSDKSSKKKSMHEGRRNNPDSSDSSSSSGDDYKRNKKFNTNVSTDSDDSEDMQYTSSDSEEGPRLKSLKETKTRSVSLRAALSYRTYRLNNRSQKFSNALSKDLSKISKRMTTHIPDDQRFDGSDPVSIIKFLEDFKEACDHNGVSEGAAMHLFQYFLLNTAKKSLQLHFRSTMSASSNSYCGAIHFLLTTYAAEEEVSGECRKIYLMQQKSGENEREFGIRIQAQDGRLGQAFTEDNLITAYLNGVPENVRTYVSSTAPTATTFAQIQIAAYNAGRTLKLKQPMYQSIPVSLPPVRRQPRTIGPLYTIEAKHSDSRPASQPSNQFKINNNWRTQDNNAQVKRLPECFLCSKDHLLHECPTLSVEQRQHAQLANQRFLSKRRDGPNAHNYKGAGFKRDEPTYLANDVEVDLDIQADQTPEYSTFETGEHSEN